MGKSVRPRSYERAVKEEPGRSLDAIMQFQNMEQKDRIDRKEAQIRAGKNVDAFATDAKPATKGLITLQDSAFGGLTGLQTTAKAETHA